MDLLLWVLVIGLGVANLALLLTRTGGSDDRAEKAVREELRTGRAESAEAGKALRGEVAGSLKATTETMTTTITELGNVQKERLETVTGQVKELTDTSHERLDRLRDSIGEQLKELREGNEKKLDEMRKTVDEKLQTTLEKRLGESFKIVSERLEAVQRGLGEMQSLATGVGDLQRVLTNVKSRGTWAEYQLGNILEQILTPDQYEMNVATRPGSREIVEYAVKFPGRVGDGDKPVWLPIDSKFHTEDYERLVEASNNADRDAVESATKALLAAVRKSAKDISTKYIEPPHTTDFGVLFVPTEGLYAEVLRQPGFCDEIQHEHRILIAGPTTLSALLNSLRMGFRTLAIEKQASEVWQVLAAVKTEFGKFGDVLDKVKRQLKAASNTIDETGVRTRVMEKKLKTVEQLPGDQASSILGLPAGDASGDAFGDELADELGDELGDALGDEFEDEGGEPAE